MLAPPTSSNTPSMSLAEDLDDDCLDFLVQNSVLGHFEKGQEVQPQGLPHSPLLLCVSGLLVAEGLRLPEGDYVPARFLGPGHVLPPTEGPALFRVRSLSSATVRSLPIDTLRAACARWPSFYTAYSATLTRELGVAYQAHLRRGSLSLELRLGLLLWSLVHRSEEDAQGNKALGTLVTQDLLGAYFGVPREEVSRKLKALQAVGLIVRTKTELVLTRALHDALMMHGGTLEVDEFMFSFTRIRDRQTSMAPLL